MSETLLHTSSYESHTMDTWIEMARKDAMDAFNLAILIDAGAHVGEATDKESK